MAQVYQETAGKPLSKESTGAQKRAQQRNSIHRHRHSQERKSEMFYLGTNDNPVDARNADSLNLHRTADVRRIACKELGKQPPADDGYTGPFSDFFKADGATARPVHADVSPTGNSLPLQRQTLPGFIALLQSFADSISFIIRKGTEHNAIEPNIPLRHIITFLLCVGALIISFRHHVKHPTSAVEEVR